MDAQNPNQTTKSMKKKTGSLLPFGRGRVTARFLRAQRLKKPSKSSRSASKKNQSAAGSSTAFETPQLRDEDMDDPLESMEPSATPRRSLATPRCSLDLDTDDVGLGVDLSDLVDTEIPLEVHDRCADLRRKRMFAVQEDPELFTPGLTPFSERFLTQDAQDRYDNIIGRNLVDMKILIPGTPASLGAEEILRPTPWFSTVTYLGKYIREVVCEFYANVPDMIENEEGRSLVYIRGTLLEFSPEMINAVFGLPDVAYTNGIRVIPSPPATKMRAILELVIGGTHRFLTGLLVRHFTHDMFLHYKACCHNWMPTTNLSALRKDRIVLMSMVCGEEQFNMGKLLYDEIISLGKKCGGPKNTLCLTHPNLIFMVIQCQHAFPLQSGDRLSDDVKGLTVTNKFPGNSPTPSAAASVRRRVPVPPARVTRVTRFTVPTHPTAASVSPNAGPSRRLEDLTRVLSLLQELVQRESRMIFSIPIFI